jgi:nuclear pore complex protein Nup188
MFTSWNSARISRTNIASTWDIAYRALCDPEAASKSDPLRAFLTATENTQILSRPWKPFPDPSQQEKSKFESKTAPISVTPTPNGHYSIDEIKEDSLWLSKDARISEYAALQLVVQEWQSRPTVQLLSGLTEEEALSVQDAAGTANLGASTLSTQLRSQTIYGNDYHSVGAGWIEELGQAVATVQNGVSSNAPGTKALDECLQAVMKRCESLQNSDPWIVSDSIHAAATERWLVAQTAELQHLLHLALTHSDVLTKGFLPATTVEDWLTFLLRCSFFGEFLAVSTPSLPTAQRS